MGAKQAQARYVSQQKRILTKRVSRERSSWEAVGVVVFFSIICPILGGVGYVMSIFSGD